MLVQKAQLVLPNLQVLRLPQMNVVKIQEPMNWHATARMEMGGMVAMLKFKAKNTAKDSKVEWLKKSKSQLQVPIQFHNNNDKH